MVEGGVFTGTPEQVAQVAPSLPPGVKAIAVPSGQTAVESLGQVTTISGGGGTITPTGPTPAQIAQQKEVERQAAAIKAAREKADRQREINRQAVIRAGTIGGQAAEVERQRASIESARGFDLSAGIIPSMDSGALGGQVGMETDSLLGQRIIPGQPLEDTGITEAGVFTITERERRMFGSPTQRFAVVPSDLTPSQAISLGAVLGGVSLTPDLPGDIQSRTAFKRDRTAILKATTDLTDAEIKAQIKRDLKDRPSGARAFSFAQDVALGGAQLGVGAVEFGVGLFSQQGIQLIEFDEGGKRIEPKKFEFGGILRDIKETPTGLPGLGGKTLLAAPIILEAGIGFLGTRASIGTRAAAGELITSFAPFKIPTQSFGVLAGGKAVKDLKFDAVSLKQNVGDLTGRTIFGKGRGVQDVSLLSKQISGEVGGKQVSFAITDIIAPQTRFQLGSFTEGLSVVRTESISGGLGGGVVTRGGARDGLAFSQTLESLTGGGARVITRTKARLDFLEGGVPEFILEPAAVFGKPRTTGAVTRRGEDAFDIFGAGRGRQILQIGREGGKVKVRVDEFNIRGVEFDISKLGARDQFGITPVIKGKGVSKPLKDTGLEVSAKQLSASISEIAPQVSSINGKQATRIITGQQGIFGEPSRFTGTGQFELTDGGAGLLPPGAKQRDVSFVDLGVGVDTALGVDLISRQKPALKPRGGVRQRPALDVRLDVGTDVITETITRQIPKQKTILKPKTREEFIGEGGFGGFGVPRPARIPPILGLPLPPLLFPTFPSGRRRGKGRRPKEAIAPSLTGLVSFDIGGITGGPLELSGRGGRSPFDIRFVPKDLAGKREPGLGLGIFTPQPSRKKEKPKKKNKK